MVSLSEFLSLLERSLLVSPERMAGIRSSLTPLEAADPSKLAGQLVQQGLITGWQARQLLEGQHAFFLGSYKLLDRIGVGGMGAVYKAEHVKLGRVVAVKLLAPSLAQKAQALARFRREVQLVSTLNHPAIVRAYDAEMVDGHYLFAMEYVAGNNLNQWLKRVGQPPIWWACNCIRQVALGLQHAHEHGLVHRDVKPGNIVVIADDYDTQPIAKLLDLGLARIDQEIDRTERLTQQGQVLGTPDYIAPEQVLDSRAADSRADVFSLGATMFKLLTGRVPFEGESTIDKLMARHTADAPWVSTYRDDVPKSLDIIVSRMMARQPEDRYQTPFEVANVLEEYSSPLPKPTPIIGEGAASTVIQALEIQEASTKSGSKTLDFKPGLIESYSSPRRRKKSTFVPRMQSPWKIAELVIALLIAVCSGIGVWWWTRPSALVLDWPQAERANALLVIDGTPQVLPDSNPVKVQVEPGSHVVVIVRDGYIPVKWNLSITRGQQQLRRPRLMPQRPE